MKASDEEMRGKAGGLSKTGSPCMQCMSSKSYSTENKKHNLELSIFQKDVKRNTGSTLIPVHDLGVFPVPLATGPSNALQRTLHREAHRKGAVIVGSCSAFRHGPWSLKDSCVSGCSISYPA